MNITQLQTLFLKMQQFAGARGMIVTASLDGEYPNYIMCRIEALDNPRFSHLVSIGDHDTEVTLLQRMAIHIRTIEAQARVAA